MTVAPAIDLNAIIPDSIEPVEAFRCWTLERGQLWSLNGGGPGAVWTPGEKMSAKCNNGDGVQHRWTVERRGMKREDAEALVSSHNQWQGMRWAGPPMTQIAKFYPPVPSVIPPDGYGFKLEQETHEAPHENCSCGIYAAITEKTVPQSGNVYGKVKLWGKVVPGDSGYRAQFAYPSEFRVAPALANHPALLAFGVPIMADPTLGPPQASTTISSAAVALASGRIGMSPYLKWAIAANVTAAALNLGLLFGRVV